ncbi:MAG: thiolase C-terminal domain-containing protein, partial [Roseinatronobacter sp.]
AATAISSGLCKTVLITHGESGRSNNRGHRPVFPSMQQQEFESIYGALFPPSRFTLPVMRKMKDDGLTEEQLAMVAVVQREWASHHPRATARDPLTVEDVLASKMIAYPFRKLMCCLVSDGGGALILTSAERARDFPTKPVYLRGTGGESIEGPMISQMESFTSSRAFRVSGKAAFESAGIAHADVDHLMIYDAFAHLPVYGLEDLGFVKPGEGGAFIAEGNTRPGGKLPLNTNGGGLSYMHSGMYGMFALQESMRQMRGISPAQVEGAKLSVVHGVGGMFSAAATVVLTNEEQW